MPASAPRPPLLTQTVAVLMSVDRMLVQSSRFSLAHLKLKSIIMSQHAGMMVAPSERSIGGSCEDHSSSLHSFEH